MIWKVADTPGRFAMASVWEISVEKVYFKIGEKEGKLWQNKKFVSV
jgi:hypothetical protein